MVTKKTITTYKAFKPDLTCNGFKYKVGKSYKHQGTIELCSAGFHACENPLDVLDFYPLVEDGKISRFALVEQSGEIKGDNKKSVSAKITIKAELSLPEYINISIKYLLDKIKPKEGAQDSNKNFSQLASSGYGSQLASSGNYSQLASSGNYSQLASSGNYSQLASSGDDSKLASSGYGSKLALDGKRGVLVSAERDCLIKGTGGTLICLCHYVNGKANKLVIGKIGENGLEANKWYGLDENGNFIEQKGE